MTAMKLEKIKKKDNKENKNFKGFKILKTSVLCVSLVFAMGVGCFACGHSDPSDQFSEDEATQESAAAEMEETEANVANEAVDHTPEETVVVVTEEAEVHEPGETEIDEPEENLVDENENSVQNDSNATDSIKKDHSPDTFITDMYNNCLIKEINGEKIWNDYISEQSKNLNLISENDYIVSIDNLAYQGINYESYVLNSVEEIEDGIYLAIGDLRYTDSTGLHNDTFNDYIVTENGEYKYLIEGITSVEHYTPEQVSEGLEISDLQIFRGFAYTEMSFEFTNQMDSALSLGWVDGSQVTVTDTEGNCYYYTFSFPQQINVSETISMSATFEKIDNEIAQIEISNVNILNERGLPTTYTGGSTVTYTLN